nr:DUF202 domain-containing protein [Rhodococcus wratislaviensis]GLK38359.1 hypothetical protein GCM10017611_52260 [Rhodococcus wratislaviensis]
MTRPVFDPGLQPERTLLAWRRTCMSFALVSLVAMRYTVETAGVAAVLTGVGGAGMSVVAYIAATLGYRRANDSLHETGSLIHGAWPIALATVAALLLGAACAAYLMADLVSLHP